MSIGEHGLIDAHDAAWPARTEAMLDEWQQAYPDHRIIAVIDAAFRHQTLLSWLEQHVPNVDRVTLYASMPGADRMTCQVSPQLVDVSGMSTDERQALFRLTSGQPMLSLIHTPESLSALAARLEPFRTVRLDDVAYVFRLVDTRRLPQMLDMLTDTQRQWLAGPAQAWWYVNRRAQWQPLNLPDQPTQARAEMPIRLDDRQVRLLSAMHDVDAIIETIEQLEPRLFARWSMPSARYEWLKQQREGVATDKMTRMAFIEYCLQQVEMS